jgi:beta-glucanase (GH16 family)
MAAAALCLSCNVSAGDYLATDKAPDTSGWNLVWQDEFNGTSVDSTKWVAETGNGSNGWGNGEAEYYTGNAANLGITAESGNSVLCITAKADTSYSGFSYTSARIKTQGKFSFQYGKVEARIKLPKGTGMWPAFWLLGDSISSISWPKCGEIDVLEMKGGISDNTIGSTLHWADSGGNHQYSTPANYTLSSGVFADDYHVFGMVWDASTISFQLDGYTYCTQSTTASDMAAAFANGKFFIILNLAVGGNYVGTTPPSSFVSQSMYVDWVRVYQKQ